MKNIKKILISLVLIIASSFALVQPSVYANGEESGSSTYTPGCRMFLGLTSWDCGTTEINSTESLQSNLGKILENLLSDALVIAAYLTIGFVIYGGYQYIIASGDAGKVATGKKTIIRALIGLAIAMLSRVIMGSILVAMTGSASTGNPQLEVGSDGGNFLKNIIEWVIGTSGTVAVIFVLIGGIGYMTSLGDASKIQKSRNTIIYALIGIVILVLAQIIVSVVWNTLKDQV